MQKVWASQIYNISYCHFPRVNNVHLRRLFWHSLLRTQEEMTEKITCSMPFILSHRTTEFGRCSPFSLFLGGGAGARHILQHALQAVVLAVGFGLLLAAQHLSSVAAGISLTPPLRSFPFSSFLIPTTLLCSFLLCLRHSMCFESCSSCISIMQPVVTVIQK